jgi:hypothetical protein
LKRGLASLVLAFERFHLPEHVFQGFVLRIVLRLFRSLRELLAQC